jgi:acetolactate synthase-1/2/3 large subunit
MTTETRGGAIAPLSDGPRAAGTVTTAEAIIARLRARGVERAFGVPGTHNLPLYRGLAATPEIRHTACRDEAGVGYGADGYARATGRPALCLVTTGPGVTNIATAIATAHADSVPMVVVAPSLPTHIDGRDTGYLHEAKAQFDAISALSGFAAQVGSPEEAEVAVDRAFAGFASGRPRPAYIEVPLDRLEVCGSLLAPSPLPGPPVASPAALEAAAKALRDSRSPAIVLGGGAVEAGAAATDLAHLLGAPVVTSVNGKGTVSEHDPLSLGSNLRLQGIHGFLGECDVVLAVGTELAESDLWRDPPLPMSGTLIRVDIDHGQIQKNAQADIALLGDAAATVARLVELLGDAPGRRPVPDMGSLRAGIVRDSEFDGGHFKPLIDVLQETLAADAIVTNDSAQVCYYGAIHYLRSAASRQFLYPTGYATLGYAVPAAIGAKVAHPGREVVALVGDGGFLYSLGQVTTAVEERLPLPVIVYNNRGYGQIRDQMREAGIPPTGVDFDTGALSTAVVALGARGVRLGELGDLPGVLAEAFGADGPTIIEICGD